MSPTLRCNLITLWLNDTSFDTISSTLQHNATNTDAMTVSTRHCRQHCFANIINSSTTIRHSSFPSSALRRTVLSNTSCWRVGDTVSSRCDHFQSVDDSAEQLMVVVVSVLMTLCWSVDNILSTTFCRMVDDIVIYTCTMLSILRQCRHNDINNST